MRKQIMPSLSQAHQFSDWDKQENSQLLPPVPISYVKENNKEPGHYDHKHSTSLHASKNGALDYESTLSFCTNRQSNQTSVINGSMKRHSDNGIIRTQVLSIPCHRGKCTLGNNHQSSDRTQSLPIPSGKAGHTEWHMEEAACTTLEQGGTITRTSLAHPLNC